MRREIPAIVAVVAGPWLAGVGGGVLFSSQVTQPSAATVRVSASRIIDEDFANASAERAFKVIRGGRMGGPRLPVLAGPPDQSSNRGRQRKHRRTPAGHVKRLEAQRPDSCPGGEVGSGGFLGNLRVHERR